MFSSLGAKTNHCASRKHKAAARAASVLEKEEQEVKSAASNAEDAIDDEEDWTDASDEEELEKGEELSPTVNMFILVDAIESTRCLFCKRTFSSSAVTLEHMIAQHSLYIRDSDYLSDTNGLLVYLGNLAYVVEKPKTKTDYKVGVGRECVQCDRRFYSVDAVRKHMRDKGHSVVSADAPDIFDFYDYG